MNNDEHAKKYPEHAKLRAIKDKSQVVGDFLTWLGEHDMFIGEQLPDETDRDGDTWPGDIVRASKRTEQLLAEFFEIDRDRLSQEKDAMLQELVDAQAPR